MKTILKSLCIGLLLLAYTVSGAGVSIYNCRCHQSEAAAGACCPSHQRAADEPAPCCAHHQTTEPACPQDTPDGGGCCTVVVKAPTSEQETPAGAVTKIQPPAAPLFSQSPPALVLADGFAATPRSGCGPAPPGRHLHHAWHSLAAQWRL
jgi:hypothetical protein